MLLCLIGILVVGVATFMALYAVSERMSAWALLTTVLLWAMWLVAIAGVLFTW